MDIHLIPIIVAVIAFIYVAGVSAPSLEATHTERYGAPPQAPKLLLHFDINKTLIAEDLTSGKPMHFIISSALAEKAIHDWDPRYPAMSYYDYVDRVLASSKQERHELLSKFIEWVESSDYPGKEDLGLIYETVMDKMQDQYLLPSFVNLVQRLQTEQIAFTIILRTFGEDIKAGRITEEIDQILEGSRFTQWGRIAQRTLTLDHSENTITKTEHIYQLFRDSEGHLAIQDSWEEWNGDDERGRSGKPFIMDPEDATVLSLFFDDNINVDHESEFNIVAPLDPYGKPLSMKRCLGRHVFAVDTIEAILSENEDYYINLVNHALIEAGHSVQIR